MRSTVRNSHLIKKSLLCDADTSEGAIRPWPTRQINLRLPGVIHLNGSNCRKAIPQDSNEFWFLKEQEDVAQSHRALCAMNNSSYLIPKLLLKYILHLLSSSIILL